MCSGNSGLAASAAARHIIKSGQQRRTGLIPISEQFRLDFGILASSTEDVKPALAGHAEPTSRGQTHSLETLALPAITRGIAAA